MHFHEKLVSKTIGQTKDLAALKTYNNESCTKLMLMPIWMKHSLSLKPLFSEVKGEEDYQKLSFKQYS